MAPYLAMVAIGRYRVHEGVHNGRPMVTAVDADLPTSVDGQLARTPTVVDFLEARFGPYPFEAIGGVVVDHPRIYFALENQSRPVYSHRFFEAGEDGGFVRVLASKTDHRLLGVQAVGQHVSELSNSFAQMLEMGAVLEDVAGTIHVHPTLGEAFHEASLRALGHAIHI